MLCPAQPRDARGTAVTDAYLCDTRRTRVVAYRQAPAEWDWIFERTEARNHLLTCVAEVVPPHQPHDGYQVLVISHATDEFRGGCVTQVPTTEFESGIWVTGMHHEPLGLVSGTFRDAQRRWPTIDKEASPVVSTCRSLEYFMFTGFTVYRNLGDLARISHPTATGAPPSKIATQRPQGWRSYLGQFRYVIIHLTGKDNLWADTLFRWVTARTCSSTPSATEWVVQMFDRAQADVPSMEVVRICPEAVAGAVREVDTHLVAATSGVDGLPRVPVHGRRALWIPGAATEMQQWLFVWGHMPESGHREVDVTPVASVSTVCRVVWKRIRGL